MLYLSDLIAFIASLFGTLTMLFIAALALFIMHVNVNVYVNGVLLHDAPNADNMMLTYLETTNQGHMMRDLMTYAVHFESTNFTIGEKEIELKKTSPIIMNSMTDKPYTLVLDTGFSKYELARVGKHTEYSVKTEAIVQAGEKTAKLTLWSG